MIQQLLRYGFVEEAYHEIQPMVARMLKNNGFYEWYTVDGGPKGEGKYRGSAGVLAQEIETLKGWPDVNQ